LEGVMISPVTKRAVEGNEETEGMFASEYVRRSGQVAKNRRSI